MKRLILLTSLLLTSGAFAADKQKPAATPNPTPAAVQPAPKPPAVDTLIFSGDQPEEIGRLTWRGGKFSFTGKADRSARLFFDKYIKEIVDQYLAERGYPRK